jgi:hypothetical protein
VLWAEQGAGNILLNRFIQLPLCGGFKPRMKTFQTREKGFFSARSVERRRFRRGILPTRTTSPSIVSDDRAILMPKCPDAVCRGQNISIGSRRFSVRDRKYKTLYWQNDFSLRDYEIFVLLFRWCLSRMRAISLALPPIRPGCGFSATCCDAEMQHLKRMEQM